MVIACSLSDLAARIIERLAEYHKKLPQPAEVVSVDQKQELAQLKGDFLLLRIALVRGSQRGMSYLLIAAGLESRQA